MVQTLERFNSLWVGDRLSYIEQLCSMLAMGHGHPFTLYSYTPETLSGVPNGVDLRDAREILPEATFDGDSKNGLVQLASDLFRYALLTKGVGYWVDMDFYFLKPLDFPEQYVFGWERSGSICNAILRAPPNSDMARDLLHFPRKNCLPPWFGPRRALHYYMKRVVGDVYVDDLPWGALGPELVTYLAKKHRVASYAQAKKVFYPLDYTDAQNSLGPASVVEATLKRSHRGRDY